MARLMSVAYTEAAVVDRSKTVTRRLGWDFLKDGDQLTLCRKVMGRRRPDGTVEPLVRLVNVTVIDVGPTILEHVSDDDALREGVPGITTGRAFVEFYCAAFKVTPDHVVTRIEWCYPLGDRRDDYLARHR